MIQLLEFLVFCYFFSSLPGFFLKYVLCLFIFYIFERYQTKIIRHYFGFEFATGMDLLFNYEDKQNKSIIVSCSIITKNFDESIRDIICKNIEKEKKYHKLKEILYDNVLFGYWRKDPKFNALNHFVYIDKEVNDEREMYEFMGKELSTGFVNNDHPKWMFYVFKKYQKDKGAIILKFHHSLVDGISMLSFFLKAGEMENVKLVNMPKISFLKWAFIYLSLPIVGVYYLFTNVLKQTDVNKIHNFELSGKKNVFSLQIHQSLTDLKNVSRRLRISINDLFTSVLMECLHGYYREKFNEELGKTIMFMPVSMRPLPPQSITCPLNNTMITAFVKMERIQGEDKEKVAKGYGKKLLALKNSFEAPMLFLLVHYAPKLLPNFAFRLFYNLMSIKPSFGFTNVPGPLERISYKDYFVDKIFFYVPTVSRIGLGFSLFTYDNKLFFSVQADEKTRINSEEFTQRYQQVMDLYIDQAMSRSSPIKSDGENKKIE